MRPTLHDDDDAVGLPAADGDASDATDAGADGASPFEPESPASTDENESVGLDAEAGIDEPIDAELDAQTLADEGTSLLEGSEAAGALSGDEDDEPDDGEASEYGHTDDNEPTDDQSMYDGAITLESEASMLEDRGEEGFDDDAVGSGLDVGALPPLDQGEGDDADLDEVARPVSTPRTGAEPAPRESAIPTRVSSIVAPPRVRVEVLQRSGRPLRALCAAGTTGFAWDGSLLVADAREPRPERRFAGPDTITGIAAIETERGIEVALITPEALMRSTDAGRSFEPRADWPDRALASSVAYVRRPGGGARLLAAAPEGALFASDDGGPFAPVGPTGSVVRLASDGSANALALLRGDKHGASIAVTHDATVSFDTVIAPVDAIERVQDVQISGSSLLCCRRAPEPRVLWCASEPLADDEALEMRVDLSSLDPGWRALTAGASTPMRVLQERHEAAAYVCVVLRDRATIVRCTVPRSSDDPSAKAGAPEVIVELPRDLGAALQIAGAHIDGITTLHVGTERAWLRVTVLPGGGDA